MNGDSNERFELFAVFVPLGEWKFVNKSALKSAKTSENKYWVNMSIGSTEI